VVLLLISITLLYAAFLTALHHTWNQPAEPPAGEGRKKPPQVSVLVAARDEAEGIGALLGDLGTQRYPVDSYEVIVVDDQSTDETPQIVQRKIEEGEFHLRLLRPGNPGPGISPKKAALALGASLARGELIICTDADCRLGPDWIKLHADSYDEEYPDMIAGPVAHIPMPGVGSALAALDLASLVGTGAALIRLGYPLWANGANISYRKAAFMEAGAFADHISVASGDDALLMQRFHRRRPGSVQYIRNRDALVRTQGPATLKDFFQQHLRWAAKWNRYLPWYGRAVPVFIFLFHALSLLAAWLTINGHFPVAVLAGTLILRLTAEYFFLRDVVHFSGIKLNFATFLLAALLYPLYAFVFGILANAIPYRWKGRRFKQ
jgi:cellulose synthase/poly-beta-1,6-N-acetylglucosamine synthase-like glycosyltransferase